MNCRQCGNPIRTKFEGGFCSSSCQQYKPPRIVPNPRYEIVDASVDEDSLVPNVIVPPTRARLIADFKALGGKPVPVTKEWLDKISGVLK
jgi:hypothetical protein